MRRFFDKNLPICISYDDGKLMIRVTAENKEKGADRALNELSVLETELEEDGVYFETTKRTYLPTTGELCVRKKTDAIIIDLALPGAVKKITEILKQKTSEKGG